MPDHGKLAPWRFIVFEGEARLAAGEAIAAAFRTKYPHAKPEQVAAERERLARAPLVIAVVSRAGPHVKIPEWEQVLSAGAAAMNLVLAAHALGYGASWITEWYAYDRGVLDALGLGRNERIAGFIHIGRPPSRPEDRPRPPLDEIATRFAQTLTSQAWTTCSTKPPRTTTDLPRDPFKAIVAPRPIGWITSMSAKGEINLAPYSFFNAVSDDPPMVLFSSEGRKDSLVVHRRDPEFVCNLATFDLREAMVATSEAVSARRE